MGRQLGPRSAAQRRTDRRRSEGLHRVLRLLRLLARGRWTMRDAGAELGVSYRTLYRDMHALRDAGVPVERQPERREVYWRIPRDALLRWLAPPC